jgi:hypothetical protein
MIAQRMKPIGWVAGVACAALSFYLVSLQVASTRASLESTERRIVLAQRQIRHLETEFSARASLRQLEAYNQDVLALAAPKAEQYLTNEVQLASYSPAEGGDIGKPAAPVALASAEPARRPVLRPAVVTDARSDGAPVIPAVKRPPLIQTVAMIEPMEPALKPRPAASPKPKEKAALLEPSALGEIARAAAKEKARKE